MKEIIIDGVNVAECCCFETQHCLWAKKYYEILPTPLCKEVKDCYYKQLKRLEQKNAELKAENEIARQAAKDFVEINEAYMKYEDCLRSIKVIAEKYLEECEVYRCNVAEEILDLIKETEV